MNALERIRARVEEETGLDAAALGPRALEEGVRRRMLERGCGGDAESYWILAGADPSELEQLIDEIVVPESWFFRDERPFEFLGEHARRWRDDGAAPLRILSAPCSRGEEPLSIAITLLEAGLSPGRFEIEAVDLSHRLIRLAGSAPYRAGALRAVPETWRRRYFEPAADGGWVASPALRDRVRFRQGNIASPDFAARLTSYHVIFCRNLLIYLCPESRERLLLNLHALLEEDGVLFIGHADASPSLLAGRFLPVRRAGAFAYRKARPAEARPEGRGPPGPIAAAGARERRSPAATGARASPAVSSAGARRGSEAPASSAPVAPGGLDHAWRLADTGRLAEAEEICRAHLERCPEDSGAYYLLGTIQLAGGRKADAESSLRRVVYLDHQHMDAMTHLAALCRSRGDGRGAGVWRRRIEKLAEKRGPVVEETQETDESP